MPSNWRRVDRINSLIQQEVAELIRSELKDPRLGFVSVVGAEVSPDLRHARIAISILGDAEAKKNSLEVLRRASGFLREKLKGRLDLRRLPELDFHIDDSIEYSIHISQVIQDLKQPDGDDET
jgi:ribosome-binding factor A